LITVRLASKREFSQLLRLCRSAKTDRYVGSA
jgi:hypothetical protein